MDRVVKIIAVVLMQIALLGYMIWDRITIIRTGTEVNLTVEPVDPRSLFRGDYVILTYPISRLNTTELEGDDTFSRGDLVFVELVVLNEAWIPVAVFQSSPPRPTASQTIVLKGKVERAYPASPVTATDRTNGTGGLADEDENRSRGTELIVAYGVESYFVPEGEGRVLEDIRDDRRMSVTLAVRADGTAAIKKLFVDGELYHQEGLL